MVTKRTLSDAELTRSAGYAAILRWAADELDRRYAAVSSLKTGLLALSEGKRLGILDAPTTYEARHERMSRDLVEASEKLDQFARQLLVCSRGKSSIATLFDQHCDAVRRTREPDRSTKLALRDYHICLAVRHARSYLDSLNTTECESLITDCLIASEIAASLKGVAPKLGSRSQGPRLAALERIVGIMRSEVFLSAWEGTTAAKGSGDRISRRPGPQNAAIQLVAAFCEMKWAAVRKIVSARKKPPSRLWLGAGG